MNGDAGWYLIRTRPRSEYKAAAGLERSGYEYYFPKVRTPKPRPGHDDTPLFPGYLFVRYHRNGNGLPPLNRISGLIGWVDFDGAVPEVPDEIIEELSQRIDAINNHGGHWRRFKPGETVQVTSGRMNNLAKVLEEPESPQSRVQVLLNFMGRMVRARVPWRDLEPVNGVPGSYWPSRSPRRTRGRGRWIRGQGPRASEGA